MVAHPSRGCPRIRNRFAVTKIDSTAAGARGGGAAVGVPGQPQGKNQTDESDGFRAQHVPGAGEISRTIASLLGVEQIKTASVLGQGVMPTVYY